MDPLLLHLAILVAAFLQGITGIGFALIAAPVLLIALDDASALQIAAFHSLSIAVVLFPWAYRHVDLERLRRFSLTSILALPVGLLLFAIADTVALKLFCGVFVAMLAGAVVVGLGDWVGRPSVKGDLFVGALSGVFGGSLSMLGPTVSIRMTAARLPKMQNRATVMAFFILGYPLVIGGQALMIGLSGETLWQAAALAPAVLIGAVGGQLAAAYVSEAAFRRAVILFQIATAVSLLADATGLKL